MDPMNNKTHFEANKFHISIKKKKLHLQMSGFETILSKTKTI